MRVPTDTFIEFARLKLAADGSDSYIMGAVEHAQSVSDPEWYAGVFTTFYAPPSHDVVYNVWSREQVLSDPDGLETWLTQHWRDIPISGARRTGAFTPHKTRRALYSYAKFLDAGGTDTLDTLSFHTAITGLERAVLYHGRYTGLKLYETLRRITNALPLVDDIRPKGGRTPRKGLQLMYPEHDYRDDSRASTDQADLLADDLRQRIPTTWFNVEMLLCNFSKAIKGSYYPGHALDQELGRAEIVAQKFGDQPQLFTNRQKLYQRHCLGEVNGWTGKRKELERTYPDHGYLWSDILYDYGRTTDLSEPVLRSNPNLSPRIGVGEEKH